MRTTTSSDRSRAVIPITVRVEEPEDRATVDDLVEEAFGEASVKRLVQLIRASDHWVPELSLVAERDGELVGHVLLSTADLVCDGDTQQILLLSPLAVRPSAQGKGVARHPEPAWQAHRLAAYHDGIRGRVIYQSAFWETGSVGP